MDVENQTIKNTNDIGTLTTQVTKLATMFEYEAGRAKEDRDGFNKMTITLQSINEKITGMAAITAEVAELRSKYDILKEWKDKYDLSNMRTRIEQLENVKLEADGAEKAISTSAHWLWAIFGPIVTIVLVAVCYYAFTHLSIQGATSYGTITGE